MKKSISDIFKGRKKKAIFSEFPVETTDSEGSIFPAEETESGRHEEKAATDNVAVTGESESENAYDPKVTMKEESENSKLQSNAVDATSSENISAVETTAAGMNEPSVKRKARKKEKKPSLKSDTIKKNKNKNNAAFKHSLRTVFAFSLFLGLIVSIPMIFGAGNGDSGDGDGKISAWGGINEFGEDRDESKYKYEADTPARDTVSMNIDEIEASERGSTATRSTSPSRRTSDSSNQTRRETEEETREEEAEEKIKGRLSVDGEAEDAALSLIRQKAAEEIAEWEGAETGSVMIYTDFSGSRSGYVFNVRKGADTHGYITVSKEGDSYVPIEFAVEKAKVESALSAISRMEEAGTNVNCARALIRTAPFSYWILRESKIEDKTLSEIVSIETGAVISIEDGSLEQLRESAEYIKDLDFRDGASSSGAALLSEAIQRSKTNQFDGSGEGYKEWTPSALFGEKSFEDEGIQTADTGAGENRAALEGMPEYRQFVMEYVDGKPFYSGAAPTAAANLLAYMNDNGREGLFNRDKWQDSVRSLGILMKSHESENRAFIDTFTYSSNVGAGLDKFVLESGHNALLSDSKGDVEFEQYKKEIDDGLPVLLSVTSNNPIAMRFDQHLCGFGYTSGSSGDFMIVQDTLQSAPSKAYVKLESGCDNLIMTTLKDDVRLLESLTLSGGPFCEGSLIKAEAKVQNHGDRVRTFKVRYSLNDDEGEILGFAERDLSLAPGEVLVFEGSEAIPAEGALSIRFELLAGDEWRLFPSNVNALPFRKVNSAALSEHIKVVDGVFLKGGGLAFGEYAEFYYTLKNISDKEGHAVRLKPCIKLKGESEKVIEHDEPITLYAGEAALFRFPVTKLSDIPSLYTADAVAMLDVADNIKRVSFGSAEGASTNLKAESKSPQRGSEHISSTFPERAYQGGFLHATVTMRNTGSNTIWTKDSGYELIATDGAFSVFEGGNIGRNAVSQGEDFTFEIDMEAPHRAGRFQIELSMAKDGIPFGEKVSVEVDLIARTDREPPTVSIIEPAGGSVFSGGSINISCHAADNTGIQAVYLFAYYSEKPLQFEPSWHLIKRTVSEPYSFRWEYGSLPSQTVMLSARAIDASGNIGESPTKPIIQIKTDSHSEIAEMSHIYYFAEGKQSSEASEFILLGNFRDETAEGEIRVVYPDGREVISSIAIPPGRTTLNMQERITEPGEISVILKSTLPIMAERALYFTWGDIEGGTVTQAAEEPLKNWYFAEGTTRNGFSEWICVMNPFAEGAVLDLEYMIEGEGSYNSAVWIPAKSRRSFNIENTIGKGKDVSIKTRSSVPVIAERTMYFDYDLQGETVSGGEMVSGAPEPSKNWCFAEGYTGSGFDTWLCIVNPGDSDALLNVRYFLNQSSLMRRHIVPAKSRLTINVKDDVGTAGDVAACVSSNEPIVVERASYFRYLSPKSGFVARGGSIVMGNTPVEEWWFAEGCTREGYDTWITLANPSEAAVNAQILYIVEDGQEIVRNYLIEPNRRITVCAVDDIGKDRSFSFKIESQQPILAERALYFNDGRRDGGSATFGGTAVLEKN